MLPSLERLQGRLVRNNDPTVEIFLNLLVRLTKKANRFSLNDNLRHQV